MRYSFLNKSGLWKHKLLTFYIKRPNHPMKLRLVGWLQKILGLEDVLVITSSGISLLLYPQDYVQYQILHHGIYEEKTLELIRSLLREGDCFIDVGSHIGLYSLEAAKITGDLGKVFAFEPNPKTFTRLLINIYLNRFKNIYPILAAVSNKSGIIEMSLPPDSNWGTTRLSQAQNHDPFFIVSTIRLDEALKSRLEGNKVNLVKIDVEGLELEVLEGLFSSCDDYLPEHIIFEYIPNHFPQAYNAAQYLLNKGYCLYDILGNPFNTESYTPLIDLNLWAKKHD